MIEPNLTDWIGSVSTAVAAAFAIIGVLLAWKSIKKDISGQQNQINALVNFTDALSKQTETLKESAKIDSQILIKLTEHISTSSEFSKEQAERYKLDIRPYFIFKSSSSSGVSGEYRLKFINDGGDLAIFHSVSIIESNPGLIVKKSPNVSDRINKGSSIEILFSKGSFQGGWNELSCKMEIKFSDKTEKNCYKQTISFFKPNIKISNVEDDSEE